MTTKITLNDNRTIQCENLIIGKTYENETTILEFSLTQSMSNKDFYLEFEKPDGNKFITPKLEIASSLNEEINKDEYYVIYKVPNSLLDIKGELKLEAVLRKDNEVWKSYELKFTILNSINAIDEVVEQYPDFINEVQKVINLIETNGEGNSYLSNDGTYKEMSSGSSDYNMLVNKPIVYLIGTDDSPIYLKDLATGKYILNGLGIPYENADISIYGNDTYIEVERNDTDVYIVFNDVINNNKEHYQIAIDGSSYIRNVISYNSLKQKENITTNSRTSTSTTLQDNLSYQTSGNQTRITLKFPEEREVGFRCWYVFKTGSTVPTFTCNYDIKWHGDAVQDNVLTISANKYYTIEFWQDVNVFNAEVREV